MISPAYFLGVNSGGHSAGLSVDLCGRVLARLGFTTPPTTDLEGLRAIYSAWCGRVPFDNVRKIVALRTADAQPLPGRDARDFFDNWLEHGTGGTCWPTSNALFDLVHSLGFEARRVAGSMRDMGVVNHASVKVRIDGGDWLLDSSMLTNVPLPLNDAVFVHADPVFAAEVEPADGTHVIWVDIPAFSTYLPCRLLVDPDDYAHSLSRYEASRERSPFNQRLYARRNRPGELQVLMGNTLFSKTAQGLVSKELSATELRPELHLRIGISEESIDTWVQSGGLAASFEPPAGPKPPPITQKPPSQRRTRP